jgi:hypothetical protein
MLVTPRAYETAFKNPSPTLYTFRRFVGLCIGSLLCPVLQVFIARWEHLHASYELRSSIRVLLSDEIEGILVAAELRLTIEVVLLPCLVNSRLGLSWGS